MIATRNRSHVSICVGGIFGQCRECGQPCKNIPSSCLIIMLNLVIVSHTMCKLLEVPLSPAHIGRDCGKPPRNTPLPYTRCCTKCGHSYVKMYWRRRGSQNFMGTLGPHPLRMSAWLTPWKPPLYVCYHARFDRSQSDRTSIIREILQKNRRPFTSRFLRSLKVIWNWHRLISRLPMTAY